LWGREGGEFSLRDEYVAIEMAQLISVAIENARLFEAIHELNQGLERKVVERSRELARQEAVFRTVADHAPQVMWIVNSKGAVTWLNRYWYELVGGSPPRWQGHDWMQAVHPDDVEQMRECWRVSERNRSVFSGLRRVIAQDGTEHTSAYRASPVYDEAGEITCWVGLDADITEIKAVEQALRLSNKELETFSYSVSHDLRSPLNTIDGFSRMLHRDVQVGGGQKADHYFSRILASVSHMSQLIDGLLALAQVARQEIRLTTVDLSTLSAEIAEQQAREHPGHAAKFIVAPDMLCRADARLLRALLQNLLGNAWKFSAFVELPLIEVGCLPGSGPMTTYFVRDNGAGFDMAYTTELFGAFERLHSQTQFKGTCIGLATVKRIVERHGGRVWADSALDQGACFYFTLRGIGQDESRPISRC
jgi:PAS domain S-box-containing protein